MAQKATKRIAYTLAFLFMLAVLLTPFIFMGVAFSQASLYSSCETHYYASGSTFQWGDNKEHSATYLQENNKITISIQLGESYGTQMKFSYYEDMYVEANVTDIYCNDVFVYYDYYNQENSKTIWGTNTDKELFKTDSLKISFIVNDDRFKDVPLNVIIYVVGGLMPWGEPTNIAIKFVKASEG